MSDDKIRVTLAYPYTDADGVAHRADSTISLPRAVASDLVYAGRARRPEDQTAPAKKAAAKRASAPTTANPADTVKE
jgi:hypothetical protein